MAAEQPALKPAGTNAVADKKAGANADTQKWAKEIAKINAELPTAIQDALDLEFVDDSCIGRYVEAQRGDAKKALRGIVSTATWRQDTIPRPLGCSVCKKDKTIHCFELVGHDQFDRPIIYGCPARATKVGLT